MSNRNLYTVGELWLAPGNQTEYRPMESISYTVHNPDDPEELEKGKILNNVKEGWTLERREVKRITHGQD